MTNRTEAAASASASGSASDNGSSSSSSNNNEDKPKRGSARRPSRSRSSRSSKGASNSAEDAEQEEKHDRATTAAATPALATEPDAPADEDAEAIDAQTAIARRQRSSELSGLGLAHLGDGDDSLAPRRSRRAQNTEDASAADQDAADPPPDAPLDDPNINSAPSPHPPLPNPGPAHHLSPTAQPLDARDEEYIDPEGVTRCICGSDDEDIGLMIQCETCKCWQHCKCMGMPTEDDCPDVYYCEQCRPELHIALLRDLGVYPHAKSQKKAGARGKETAASQLREAREAVALLAKQNAQRRLDGLAPIATGATRPQRRNTSESHDTPSINAASSPKNPSASMDPYSAAARKSPKRRSTMNSRDSGWEYIPPGLLIDEEEQQQQKQQEEPKKEDDDSAPIADGRKRKRDSRDTKPKRDEETSPSPAASPATSTDKRRRMSASSSAATLTNARQRRSASNEDKEEGAVSGSLSTTTEPTNAPTAGAVPKKGKGGAAGKNRPYAAAPNDENASLLSANKSGSKQPNQYTYRNGKERVLGAASGSGASANRAVSPTPSPSKGGRRGVASLREGSTMPSRTGTPAPGSGRNTAWNLPEHLSHLASFLPTPTPESLQTTLPTTRGSAGTSRNDANASSSTLSSSRPSPHAFQTIELTEPPTKVRWPSKRATLTEMRKRVRNMSDWVAKTQSETMERARRTESLGIRIDFPPCPYPLNSNGSSTNQTSSSSGSTSGTSTANREGAQSPNRSNAQSTDGDVTMQDARAEGPASNGNGQQTASTPAEAPRASLLMMEDIMRDVVDWINRFGATATAAAVVSVPSGSKSGNVAATPVVAPPAAAPAEDEAAEQDDEAGGAAAEEEAEEGEE